MMRIGRIHLLVMPYQHIEDLPDSVKHHIPKHAQEIFGLLSTAPWKNIVRKNEPFE
jgi:cation transport regulator ChaB